MIASSEEVARSLAGAWDLLQRRTSGLRRFDFSARGFYHSFWSLPLAAPAFVTILAGERAREGLLVDGAGLFDNWEALGQAMWFFAATWLMLPVLGYGFARLLNLNHRVVPFIIACNWSSVIAAVFLAFPALLFAIGWATPALATLYGFAFLFVVVQMRWFVTKATLGVSGGVAAALICCEVVSASALGVLVV
jgi:hypothetical protein